MTLYPSSLSKQQREDLGMVFTDSTVSSFIAKRSLKLLKASLQNKNQSILDARILDPCVGGGSFIISFIDALKADEGFDKPRLEVFLSNNIIGIDIENEAIKLTKKNLEVYGISTISSPNIYTADFLDGFKDKGFDLIIGNPPYIGEKGNKETFSAIKNTEFGKKYYEKGMDYFYYFIEKSLELLNEDGILAMITPTYWTRADSASKLREAIRNAASFIEVIDFGEVRAFKDAVGHHSMIFFLQKKQIKEFDYYQITDKKKSIDDILALILEDGINEVNKTTIQDVDKAIKPKNGFTTDIVSNSFCMNYSPYFSFIPKYKQKIFDKIKEKAYCTLGDIATINQGIVSGADKVTKRNIRLLDNEDGCVKVGDGIFVLTPSQAKDYIGKCKSLVPFYKNSDIESFAIKKPKYYLFYATVNAIESDKTIMISHLSKYKEILNKRRECLLGKLPYYCLQWARKESVFIGEKIVAPQRALTPRFAYSNEPMYASADVYFITQMKEDPYFLLGYLNSSFSEFYLRYVGKTKGDYLELYQRPLSEIPIINIKKESKLKIAELSKKLCEVNIHLESIEKSKYRDEIDNIIWQEL